MTGDQRSVDFGNFLAAVYEENNTDSFEEKHTRRQSNFVPPSLFNGSFVCLVHSPQPQKDANIYRVQNINQSSIYVLQSGANCSIAIMYLGVIFITNSYRKTTRFKNFTSVAIQGIDRFGLVLELLEIIYALVFYVYTKIARKTLALLASFSTYAATLK